MHRWFSSHPKKVPAASRSRPPDGTRNLHILRGSQASGPAAMTKSLPTGFHARECVPRRVKLLPKRTAQHAVGPPDAARLHKASKASPRVAVYTHKDAAQLVRQLAGERIHRAESVEIHAVDRDLIAGMVAHLDRRTTVELAVTDRHLYATIDGVTLDGRVEAHRLTPADG